MTRPQFAPSVRPLSPRVLAAAVRRFRQLCDIIERYSDPKDTREKAQLTRAIYGLAYGAKDLSARHRRAAAALQSANARDGDERGTRHLRAASAASTNTGSGAGDGKRDKESPK